MALKRKRITWGQVGHWISDDGDPATAPDHSGNLNHGTIYGATWTAGKIGRALSFAGDDDYVDVGNRASLNFSTGNFSLIVWIKSTFSDLNRWILSKYTTGNTKNYHIYQTALGKISFRIADGTTSKTTISPNSYNDGEWHHVAGVRSGDYIYLYIDGSEVASTSGVSTYDVSNTVPFIIGARQGGTPPAEFYNGSIDEVRIWNRALDAFEINDLYSIGRKRHAI